MPAGGYLCLMGEFPHGPYDDQMAPAPWSTVPCRVCDLVGHGIGNRADLPLPLPLALGGAVVAVAASFVLLIALWPQPAIHGGQAGKPLPTRLVAFIDSPAMRWALRAFGLAVTGLVAFAAWFGPDDALNPTAAMVYAVFWVGVVAVASALLGPVWRWLNPLRTVHLLVCMALRRDPSQAIVTYRQSWGLWPAAALLGSFLWLELVAPGRASVVVIRDYATVYAVLGLLAAGVFGSRWFERGDGFEVLSTLFGRLSVLGRRDDGVAVLRSPLAGLDQMRTGPGLVAVVTVVLGGTAYDGLSAEPWWQAQVDRWAVSDVVAGTLGLTSTVLLVAAAFTLAARAAGRIGAAAVPAGRDIPGRFAPSLVPVALGYTIAHYFSLLVLAGQLALIDLSDPLGTGANLFGTGQRGVDYTLLQPTVVAWVQIIAVVTGHIIGVVLAHDRAVSLFPPTRAAASQIPLLIVMLLFTGAGIWLLWSA